MMQEVANRERKTFNIELDDVFEMARDQEFVENIKRNTLRYVRLFSDAVDSLLPEPNVEMKEGDISDVWNNQREQRLNSVRNSDDVSSGFPTELTRRFEIRMIPRTTDKRHKLREIRAAEVGSLCSVKGIVTRVSDVQPLVRVIAYICQVCGYESYQTVTDKQVTPLNACPSKECKDNSTEGKLFQLTRGSKFVRYQEIKLQEQPCEVPVGHIPRAMTLKVYGELTRKCRPGELITASGIFLPAPYTGYRAIKAGLTTETYLEVMNLESHKKNYAEMETTEELNDEIEAKSQEKDIYDNLAQSIAPEIFGHVDIKKALILLLTGGVTRKMKDGMRIRGDINVLLMGDPGVAKSQLLKHICRIAPRGIYTTGKGSSGVGLTAAVTKDPVTGEMALEGGALVLADKGICCIDEFDKMEESDRTAIHEVMEQQTVSIAKAGITTTLNARTAVLAAANPLFGRWRPNLPMQRNMNIPAALLSRFDLTFILLDKPDGDFDRALASHVTHVHRENSHPALDFTPFSSKFLRAYVSKAREYNPWIPPALTDYIVGSYVGMRKGDDDSAPTNNSFADRNANQRQTFCTPRALLGILRLSQAIARVHFRNEVTQEDVEEAMRLLQESKASATEKREKENNLDTGSAIYQMVKAFAQNANTTVVKVSDLLAKIAMKKFTEGQLKEVMDTYEDLGVWTISPDRTKIRFSEK